VFGFREGEDCVGLDDGDDGESVEAEEDNGVAGVSIGEGGKINGCGIGMSLGSGSMVGRDGC
jgi:hypothetical protein